MIKLLRDSTGRLRWAALLFLALCLASCQQQEDGDGAAAAEKPHSKAASGPRAQPVVQQPPLSTMPLRRSATSANDYYESVYERALRISGIQNAWVVSADKADSGEIVLRAVNVASVSIQAAEALGRLGFRPAESGAGFAPKALELHVPAAWRAAVRVEIAEQLSSLGGPLSVIKERLSRRSPGTPIPNTPSETNEFSPGTLVYTGHPLDVALSDANPPLFIAVNAPDAATRHSMLFVRGGQIYFDEDGSVKINGFTPGGTWIRLPHGAAQAVVNADGRVLAAREDGSTEELGRLQVFRLRKFSSATGAYAPDENAPPEALEAAEKPGILPGHLEYPEFDVTKQVDSLSQFIAARELLASVEAALANASASAQNDAVRNAGPLVLHAPIPWAEEHLKALKITVDHNAARTVIGSGAESTVLAEALVTVLQGLQKRIAVHEENLRNADRIRDAENRINPYRRKIVKLDAKGVVTEELDPAPLPKTYKPGDANAGPDGFVTLPNVNKAVETAEFNADIYEYKILRTALERLDPREVFPDPPSAP